MEKNRMNLAEAIVGVSKGNEATKQQNGQSLSDVVAMLKSIESKLDLLVGGEKKEMEEEKVS
jgi:hypothetical protein